MGLGTDVTPANGVGIPIRLTFCATLGLWTLPGAMLVCWTCDLCCKGRISTPWSDEANMWSGVWLRFPPLWLECGDPFMYWGLNFPWKLKITSMIQIYTILKEKSKAKYVQCLTTKRANFSTHSTSKFQIHFSLDWVNGFSKFQRWLVCLTL